MKKGEKSPIEMDIILQDELPISIKPNEKKVSKVLQFHIYIYIYRMARCSSAVIVYSESGSSSTSSSVICDSDDGVGCFLLLDVSEVDGFVVDDAEDNAACTCASICCLGKSCDGHSKWTQWKIYKMSNENENFNVWN